MGPTHAPPPAPAPPRARTARGFTLIEAAMVVVVIGVGVLAMLQLLAAGTVANADAATLTTALTLANNIDEMSLGLAFYDPNQDPKVAPRVWNSKELTVAEYDNIMDLDGPEDTWNNGNDPANGYQVFSPPIDGNRQPISGHSGWAQWVKVETVDSNQVKSILPHDPDAPMARVTVKILRGNREVARMSWLAAAPVPTKSTIP